MKIERITKKSLLETIKAEGLEKVGAFIDGKEIVREPGIIGVARTAAGNHMVYCVNAQGKLHHTSVHANRREANGRVLERFRAIA